MKRNIEEISEFNSLKKKSEDIYLIRDEQLRKEQIYLYTQDQVYQIDSIILFTFYIYKEIYFEIDNEVWQCKNTNINAYEIQEHKTILDSQLVYENYKNHILLYELPPLNYKLLIRYTSKYKSPFIRFCTYYSLYKQYNAFTSPSFLLSYLNLSKSILGEFIYALTLIHQNENLEQRHI